MFLMPSPEKNGESLGIARPGGDTRSLAGISDALRSNRWDLPRNGDLLAAISVAKILRRPFPS
ncbi:hypothetical protein L484_017003 [Morus notabilis]|uniref:Uncharacterized protein n=1 Tax=Morus notabilis TaxID=981085 RepID=W9RKT6_9ROSA|nr:hypothetical protein L484_017003 [Morus notabilis]